LLDPLESCGCGQRKPCTGSAWKAPPSCQLEFTLWAPVWPPLRVPEKPLDTSPVRQGIGSLC